MRFRSSPLQTTLLSTLLLPYLASAISIDCTKVLIPGHDKQYNLQKLGGPRSTIHSLEHGNGTSYTRSIYTIDICAPLKPAKDEKDKNKRCPVGTRICAIERFENKEEKVDAIQDVFPVAGELQDAGGKSLEPKWAILKDSTKEGISVELSGGFNEDNGKTKPQKAIVEFICDKDVEGTENLYDPEDKYETKVLSATAEEPKDEKKKNGTCMYDLSFGGYDQSQEIDVLKLSWRTKYVCADVEQSPAKGGDPKSSSAHWGFFTWFILIAFLGTAAYLIFGSWLNYTRYGARGWDLLPHGDAIRDVPYLMKDWTRKVVGSVQGGGSSGGYAAV